MDNLCSGQSAGYNYPALQQTPAYKTQKCLQSIAGGKEETDIKALILSCNTGEGHNSCARAVEEYIKASGGEALRADALSFISNDISSLISRGHVFMYRHLPWLFKRGYGFSEKHGEVFAPGSPVWRLMGRGTGRLRKYIEDRAVDTVICPHIFPEIMLTLMQRKKPLNIRSAFIATDYTFPPGADQGEMDWYFVAGDEKELPVPEEKTVRCPVPVRQEFYEFCPGREAKKQLGIDPDKKHLLVMCGSMGCGPMRRICYELKRHKDADTVVTVICGTNKRLRLQLERALGSREDFNILGYTENMSLMMDASELCLTKPGGISTSEAAVKALPMVLVNTVSGCEKYNLEYMLKMGIALTAPDPAGLAKLCAELLRDEKRLENMRNAAQSFRKINSAETVYETLCRKEGRDK